MTSFDESLRAAAATAVDLVLQRSTETPLADKAAGLPLATCEGKASLAGQLGGPSRQEFSRAVTATRLLASPPGRDGELARQLADVPAGAGARGGACAWDPPASAEFVPPVEAWLTGQER
jgi:hypothetical protein